MLVYRLTRKKFALPLSGIGAAIKGARWNSPGIELIYTAENRSLAMAEVLVHLSAGLIPHDYVVLTIEIPAPVAFAEILTHALPLDWNAFPPPPDDQFIGDQFVMENAYAVLKIPSAVTKGEYNFLINPRHPDFKQISVIAIDPFDFDRRLFT